MSDDKEVVTEHRKYDMQIGEKKIHIDHNYTGPIPQNQAAEEKVMSAVAQFFSQETNDPAEIAKLEAEFTSYFEEMEHRLFIHRMKKRAIAVLGAIVGMGLGYYIMRLM